MVMADSKKTRRIAGHLIKKHGRAAAAVVMGKAKDCAAVGDHEDARTWTEVAGAVPVLLGAGWATAAGDEPPLGDVLEGSVITAAMNADGVERAGQHHPGCKGEAPHAPRP